MRHIIILFATILFASCSAMTSDFSEMKRAIQKPEIVFENPKIEEESKTIENKPKAEDQEIVEENSKDSVIEIVKENEQETVDDSQKEMDENILIEEPEQKKEIEKTDNESQEESIVEEKTIEIKETVIEEVLIENDTLKISKINDTYIITNEDTTVEFTKEDVMNNDRFLWIIPYQSCVYESNGKLFFLDYNNFSEISLDK